MTDEGPDIARGRLEEIAHRIAHALADVDQGFVFVTEADAAFLSQAIGAFLSGEHATMDSAFGLVRPRGRPKSGPQDRRTMDLVKAAMMSKAKTWDDIASDPAVIALAGRDGIDADVLRKLVARHRSAAEREFIAEAAKRLLAGLAKRKSQIKG